MPSLNATARNFMADAVDDMVGTGTLQILAGATVLAEHTLTGFGAASSGVITANAVANATIANSGTANSAKIIQLGREITLTVGTSGAEVILSSLNYVAGGTSQVTSITITYPAS